MRRFILSGNRSAFRRCAWALAVTGMLGVLMVVAPATAQAATAGLSPIASRTPTQVTADALPTVQIDGIVWAQTVVGAGNSGVVFAGGNFANARPAGAAPGTNLTKRGNLLAYNVSTGQLVTTFAPTLNAQVLAVAASPDGSRVYVGGDFTTANGVTHHRLAAYSVTTGQLISTFNPDVGGRVKTIVATNTTVYVGGAFASANGHTRSRLAAFSATDGALLGWAPAADYNVLAMVLSPNGTRLFVGGAFQNVNGSPAYGLAALDATSGALLPWPVNTVVRDAGPNSAIESLSTDGISIFGVGYVFGSGGNLEGAFSANPTTGAINWIEDCHGDTYSSYPMNGALYTVSHAHYCGNIGSFFQSDPWSTNQRHALAFTTAATGTVGRDFLGYVNWSGYASPSQIAWYPDMTTANVSGANQAAWSVSGNGTYVVLGGEFPTVNGVGQQGLVRFAVKPVAPSVQGGRLTGVRASPTLLSTVPGTVRVAFGSNWDRDDQTLTYRVVRDGLTASPVYTVTADSQFWNRPARGFTDTGLVPGTRHGYRLYETDADGNTVAGDTGYITVAAASTLGTYAADVRAAGAIHYWRLGEPSGTNVYDYTGYDDAAATAVIRGTAGAIIGDSNTASSFNGTSSQMVNQTLAPGPNTFSIGAWFSTTSTAGGKIVGYGDENIGASVRADRHIYLDAGGLLHFGVYNGTKYTIDSTRTYNDGKWHQVVATLGAQGMALYVDGALIGVNRGTTVGQSYSGFWRIGGDRSWSGGSYFSGSIDEVAIYPTPLTAATVRQQYLDSGRS